MKYFITLIFPFLTMSQVITTSNLDKEMAQYRRQMENTAKKENIVNGTVFYHKTFMTTNYDGKKIKVMYDAYSDLMSTEYGPNILAYQDNLVLLLDNKETWITFNNKWYRLLFENGDLTYLHKPYVEYYPPKTAESGFEGNKLAEYKMKEKYFVMKNGIINKLKRKEVKKLGLKKLTKN